MKIVDRGVVFKSLPGTGYQSCTFPFVCVAAGGRLLCGFRAASSKNLLMDQKAVIARSDDGGRTWSMPHDCFNPPEVSGKPGTFRCIAVTHFEGNHLMGCLMWCDNTNPKLPIFNPDTNGVLDCRIFFTESDDNSENWSTPELVHDPFNVPLAITGPVLKIKNGEIACQFELNKHYHDPGVWKHSSVLLFSSDMGKNWDRFTLSSNDPENRIFYWDQRPTVLSDGSILDLFWTYDTTDALYLNIHARESKDGGHTWSEIRDTGIPGQPAPLVEVDDGRLIMAHMDRTGTPLLRMISSSDCGRTWDVLNGIVLAGREKECQTIKKRHMNDAISEMNNFSLGLPSAVVLPDGDIFVVYYEGPDNNSTDIKWVRVRPD